MKKSLIPLFLGSLFLAGCTNQSKIPEESKNVSVTNQVTTFKTTEEISQYKNIYLDYLQKNIEIPASREIKNIKISENGFLSFVIITDKVDEEKYPIYIDASIGKTDIDECIDTTDPEQKEDGEAINKGQLVSVGGAGSTLEDLCLKIGDQIYLIERNIGSTQPTPERAKEKMKKAESERSREPTYPDMAITEFNKALQSLTK